MIDGAHLLLFTTDPHSDQAALERILGTPVVPAGEERVIIALPPGEIATHVTSDEFAHRHAGHDLQGTALYLMCNDLDDTIEGHRGVRVFSRLVGSNRHPLRTGGRRRNRNPKVRL